MSANINPDWAVIQYSSQFQLLLQRQPVLSAFAQQGSYVGKQASPVNQIGAVAAQKVTTKFAPMGRVDAPLDRRWVYPVDYELPQLVDTLDELRILGDPKSALVENGLKAMGRAMDDELYQAFFGIAQTGEQGGVAVPFGTGLTTTDAGNNVDVQFGAAAPTNLTVAKIREGKRRLMFNNVDPSRDRLLLAVSPKEMDNLLSEVQVIDKDYEGIGAIVKDGIVQRVLGVDIVLFNGVTKDADNLAGSSNQIPMWAQSGMHMGVWNGIKTDVTQRRDLISIPWQVYCMGTFGATRLEENKIVRIWAR